MKKKYLALLLATTVLATNVVLPVQAITTGEDASETVSETTTENEESVSEELEASLDEVSSETQASTEITEETDANKDVLEVLEGTDESSEEASKFERAAKDDEESVYENGSLEDTDVTYEEAAGETEQQEADSLDADENSIEASTPVVLSLEEEDVMVLDEEAASEPLAVGSNFTVDYITYKVISASDTPEVQPTKASFATTTITIPGSVTYEDVTYVVTSIPNSFKGHNAATKLVISEGIRTVGELAFEYCSAVTELSLPASLETFTTMGFASVETITLADGNENFQLIDGVLFTKGGSKLWLYPSGKAGTSYTIPEGTTTIEGCAFYENQNLQTITLSNSVTTLEEGAFFQLNALTSLTLGSNVSSIGDYNLYGCSNLETLTLKNSGALGNYCVYECDSLETIIIDGSMTGHGAYALYNLPSLQNYDVVNSPCFSDSDGVLYAGTELVRYPAAKTDSIYVLPEDTTIIAGLAFNHMQNTSTVILNPGVSLKLMAFHYPNESTPMTIHFRDKDSVTMSTSTSGVFVGLESGSKIYLPTNAALTSFNTYTSAINPSGSATAEIGTIPSTAIDLSIATVDLKPNETATVTATLTPYYTTDGITWSSDAEAIATVSTDGVITAVGYGECTITATTDSGLTKTVYVTVSRTDIETLTVDTLTDRAYTGSAQTPDITITNGDYTLVKGTDFTVDYANNVNVGTATVTLTGIGDYEGEKVLSFKIEPKSITEVTVNEIAKQLYAGYGLYPTITVTDGSAVLTKGTDYEVVYSDNVNTGTAKVIVTGIGNYTGVKEVSFGIDPKSISEVTVNEIAKQLYTGDDLCPTITVTDGSTALTKGTDYEVVYSNNVNTGTAKVTVNGIGNYTGKKVVSFEIEPKSITGITVSEIAKQFYTVNGLCPMITVTDGSTVLTKGTDYEVVYSNNVSVGTAKVTVNGIGNYTGEKEVSFEIEPKSITEVTVIDIAKQLYTGKDVCPAIIVKDGTTVLARSTDYKVSYADNVDIGTAKVIVTGIGNYTGEKEVSFAICEKVSDNTGNTGSSNQSNGTNGVGSTNTESTSTENTTVNYVSEESTETVTIYQAVVSEDTDTVEEAKEAESYVESTGDVVNEADQGEDGGSLEEAVILAEDTKVEEGSSDVVEKSENEDTFAKENTIGVFVTVLAAGVPTVGGIGLTLIKKKFFR